MLAPLAISTGDPAGVGPVVTAAALAQCIGADRAVVYGDAAWMEEALRTLGLESVKRIESADASALAQGQVGLVHVADWPLAMVQARAPTIDGGAMQCRALDAACDATIAGHTRALVTGPVSKEAVYLSGVSFRGQTEHLARRAGVHVERVTMMFLGPRLKVALVATHWPIKRVPSTITAEHIKRTVHHLAEALMRWLPDQRPLRIEVSGLNPHAGEGGLLGTEEETIISPALDHLCEEPRFSGGEVELRGPTPAEAAFRHAADGRAHGIVAMFHDQATIPSKLLDWGQAVNVTWGLPFVRTSVDHGVAYDAAAAGTASESGMIAAIRAAQRLTGGTPE
ncbi:MAG: 4-hydroxythreonine-4-phosphate dehydrogenase PdxA [Myxococcales bacterium]|nr:4-hydroxythreonine-4-phosphate dehydrogenase PdxA [Myxococcales bacterium]MDH3845469.1 4-hydroxythreonine-4-phosphate dehydrogenase PdxA [Myxococcales bacterium]